MEFIKPKPMPIGVRNAFLLHSIIGFVLAMAAVAICKAVDPRNMILATLAALGACIVGSGVNFLRYACRPDRNNERARDAEQLIGISAYAFCAFAAATGATFSASNDISGTFTGTMMLITIFIALLSLKAGTDTAIGAGAEAVTARMRLRILPIMQVLCFSVVLAN